MLSFPTQCLPVYRNIIAVDIEQSTSSLRTNPVKQDLRRSVYVLLGKAMETAGISPQHCDAWIDRGDGVLVMIPPSDQIPKTLLLNPLIPEFNRLLVEYNAGLSAADRASRSLRIRVVIHAGEVHSDGQGPFGEEVDVACRLLDAPRFKQSLREASGPLALVVSEEIYWAIVRHRYDGICAESFQQIVRVNCAGRRRPGWVHVPPGPELLTNVFPLRSRSA